MIGSITGKEMIVIEERKLTVDEYLGLRAKVGWKKLTREQAKKSIDNALYMVAAYENGMLVGMGRIVGDGAVICYIQDLIVTPECHGRGIGTQMIQKLRDFVISLKESPDQEIMFGLMCAKGREVFYQKNGFIARPTEKLGPGMIQYL